MRAVLLALLCGCIVGAPVAFAACSSTPNPVDIANAVPVQCYGALTELVAISKAGLSCHQDAGTCDLKVMRNDAVDALANCIKAAP